MNREQCRHTRPGSMRLSGTVCCIRSRVIKLFAFSFDALDFVGDGPLILAHGFSDFSGVKSGFVLDYIYGNC